MPTSLQNLLDDADFQGAVPFQIRLYPAGEAIVRESDPGTEIYLILKGRAEVYAPISAPVLPEQRAGVCRLAENDVFGELSLFDHEARIAHVIAATECTIAAIDGPALASFMDENPEPGYRILKEIFCQLVRRMRQAALRANTITALYLNDNAV